MKRRAVAKALLVVGFTVLTLGATMELAHAQAEDGTEQPAEKKEDAGGTLKTVGAYALGLVGVGILVIAVTQTLGKPSYPQARLTLVNMLRTHPNHAEMLARNMVHTFGEAIGNAMKTASAAGSPDPKVLQSALAPTYDGLGQAVVAHWKAVLGKGKLGVMAAGGGFVLGLTGDGFPIGPFLITLVAAGCFLRVFLFTHDVQQSLLRARAEVLPEALNAMASGRYVFPPPPV